MAEEILINVTSREVRIAYLEKGILQDIHIERNGHQGIIGNIYKGKVNRLLPGIQAAFIDIGLDRAAFLHVKDIIHDAKSVDIRDVLHPGQELLVQVYKDPLGSKGARLTTQFAIPARYLVLTPHSQQVTVSHRVTDEAERERLLAMVTATAVGGYIFRTAACGAKQEQIDTDKQYLHDVWQEINSRSQHAKVGHLVYNELPLILRSLRDMDSSTIEKIRIDDMTTMQQMQSFTERCIPELSQKIEYHADIRPIFDIHQVENQLQNALHRKINLKSGGYIIFDQTEAMTTIDVNTGSYAGKGKSDLTSEEAIYKTNIEAIDVIAKQVRLRNLGGIIIIDFIDMENPDNKQRLIQQLIKAMANDSVRTEVSELSSLGLVQMTRKRTRESLEHVLCVPCPTCQRRGSLKSLQTIAYDIIRELKQAVFHFPQWPGYTVLATDQVIQHLSKDEMDLLNDLKQQIQKPIQLKSISHFLAEQFEILPMEGKAK